MTLHIISVLTVVLVHLSGMSVILTLELLDVALLLFGHLSLEVLDVSLERLDFLKKGLLVLLLHQGVFLEVSGILDKSLLELLSGVLTVPHELLVLGNVLLEVVEDLELLVQSDQSVELVLKFDLFLLKGKLELILLALVKHRHSEALGVDRAGDLSRRGCSGLAVGGGDRLSRLVHWGASASGG